jgi:DHA1 family bicyclomycin/chloramphenicol resistance-like MFS transporter
VISTKTKTTSYTEFVIVVSMMIAITALSIDTMLPALSQIGSDLGVSSPNDRQLIVSLIFFGLAVGQIFFGPLSDSIGRKATIYTGYALFIAGSLISLFSVNFPMMLVGRAMQGIGVSSPRAVTLAIVRDQFEGRLMARLMSFVMTVFILVPMIAPSIGQGILSFAGWRSIFGAFILFALVTTIWFGIRIPETLAIENRRQFSIRRIVNATREIVKIRTTLGYTISLGFVQGAFLGYLNSSQQIFQEQYALGDLFPVIFGVISLALGTASFLNARLVMRFGMRALVRWALGIVFSLAVVFLAVAFVLDGQPPLWSLMAYLMTSFFCIGILFGNFNALTMEPLGQLAGVGAAFVGSFSTLISMLLGTAVGQNYNGTILPLVIGMVILTGISNVTVRWAES